MLWKEKDEKIIKWPCEMGVKKNKVFRVKTQKLFKKSLEVVGLFFTKSYKFLGLEFFCFSDEPCFLVHLAKP